jgi:hypothetical protein
VRDSGREPTSGTERRTLDRHGRAITSCRIAAPHDRATFAGFALGAHDKVATFSVNGNPLATRIVSGPGHQAEGLGASFLLLVGYQSAADDLSLVGALDADSTGPTIDALDATYVNPDGRLVATSVEQSNLPADPLPARFRATVAFTFASSAIGGRLRIPVTDASGNQTTLELAVTR